MPSMALHLVHTPGSLVRLQTPPPPLGGLHKTQTSIMFRESHVGEALFWLSSEFVAQSTESVCEIPSQSWDL